MKKRILLAGLAVCAFALGSLPVPAQDQGGSRIIPVDLFACTFRDGKGPADLDAAVGAWNAWADASAHPDVYAAWTLTKHYAGRDQDFDFLWLGAWKSANAMGAGQDNYLANGGAIQAGFNEVAACTTSNFASINLRRTPNNDTPSDGVVAISNCSFKNDATEDTLAAAEQAWSAILDEHGLEVGIFRWYPIFGGGGQRTFDFKGVTTFRNHTAFGAYYEAMANGGLYRQNAALFDAIVSCDSARVYNARSRRFTQLRK